VPVPIRALGEEVVKGPNIESESMDYLDCIGFRYLDTCIPVCKFGYYRDTTNGAGTLTCEAEKLFVGTATCLHIPCASFPDITLPAKLEGDNGKSCNTLVHGDRCNIICPTGSGNEHTSVGSTYFECVAGQWVREDDGGKDYECEPAPCMETPEVFHGADMSNCSGLAHGEKCNPRCRENYIPQGEIVCQAGRWQIGWQCLFKGDLERSVETVSEPAIFFVQEFDPGELPGLDDDEDSGPVRFDFNWAIENENILRTAYARSLDVEPFQIRLEIYQFGGALIPESRRLRMKEDEGKEGTVEGLARKLQSSNAFRIRVAVILSEGEDPNDMMTKINENLVTTSSPSNTIASDGSSTSAMSVLQQNVIATLTEQNLPIPTGIETATVVAKSVPTFIEEYVITAANWLVEAFGVCDNICGYGQRHRIVECPAGIGACRDEMPATEEDCVDWEGCEFDIMCPMGQGITPDCGTQILIIMGVISFVALAWCLVISRRIYRKCIPPKEGTHVFDKVDQAASYKVYHPRHMKKKDKLAAQKIIADGKVHVVWEIDQPFVESWFQDKQEAKNIQEEDDAHQRALKLAEDAAGVNLQFEESESEDEDEEDQDSEDSDGFIEQKVGDLSGDFKPQLIYEDGEKVEYFSGTHQRWVPARIKVEVKVSSKDPNLAPIVMYDVMMAHSICHKNVDLNLLRLPFQHGELVELFSKRKGGTWLPGMIAGVQQARATMQGYSVHLDDMNEIFQDIPAVRLRRRFPPGTHVRVYRGPREGWNHNAIVHHSAPKNGIGAEQIPFHKPEISHADVYSLQDVRVREAQMLKAGDLGISKAALREAEDAERIKADRGAHSAAEPSVLDHGLWTQVPIDLSKDDDYDDFVILPSYLLSMVKTDPEDLGRRQVAL
jgi:hypothetical protein